MRISDLTGAHAEIAGDILDGYSAGHIAQKRGIPLKSAQRLVKETYDKLGVADAGELKVRFKDEVGPLNSIRPTATEARTRRDPRKINPVTL